ncbi:MAG TPA: collagen-binding domain-containing protein, partial [Phytomonospora sp.]
MRMIISAISAGGVLLLAAAVAQGVGARPAEAVITPLAGAGDFNAFVEGDARLFDGEMEGPLAVGGDLTLSGGYRVAIHTPGTTIAPGDALPAALVVNGRVDWAASASNATLDVFDGYVKIGDMSGGEAHDRDSNGASQSTRVNRAGDDFEDLPHISTHVEEPLEAVE